MLLTPSDIDALALGCTLLGSGGGGSVAAAEPLLRHTLEAKGPLRITPAAELPPEARVACIGAVGSSTVMLERMPSGTEFVAAVRALERHLGLAFDAVQTLEIGGVNGLLGPAAAAWLELPLLDSDAMGRAYPRLDHTVLLGAVPAAPLALADPSGNLLLLDEVADRSIERIVRAVLPALGTWAAVCLHHGSAREYAEFAVQGSISRALALGRAPLPEAGVVFEGTVLEVNRRRSTTDIGGVISINHASDEHRSLRLDFANEYVAAFDDGVPVAMAPDIICVLDARTSAPVSVERLAAHQRVRLLRLPAPPELHRRHPGQHDLGPPAYGLAPVDLGARADLGAPA